MTLLKKNLFKDIFYPLWFWISEELFSYLVIFVKEKNPARYISQDIDYKNNHKKKHKIYYKIH